MATAQRELRDIAVFPFAAYMVFGKNVLPWEEIRLERTA